MRVWLPDDLIAVQHVELLVECRIAIPHLIFRKMSLWKQRTSYFTYILFQYVELVYITYVTYPVTCPKGAENRHVNAIRIEHLAQRVSLLSQYVWSSNRKPLP